MEQTLDQAKRARRFAVGAEPRDGGTDFRVWAPRHREVAVAIERGQDLIVTPLQRKAGGYFSGFVVGAVPGDRYWYALGSGGENDRFPDPASRFQPEGPHRPSEIVDPSAFRWTDGGWPGAGREGQVIYEMHIGTYTPEGTWRAATEQLPALAALGVTMLELMPVADFVGSFGWGYDGVNLYAPTRLYGRPADFRAFVDRAHALKLAVILDVVYNHFGPDGCYVSRFSDHYFSKRHENEWGDPLNFDGDHSGPVREYFIENAGYWIEEYHLDGLRLDATQSIIDASPVHVVSEVVRRARQAAGSRRIFIVAENEPQESRLLRPPAEGGFGIDAVWNDDFHHAAVVALTGRAEAYYMDYAGTPQEFVSAQRHGYLYQGQHYAWQDKPRGDPTCGVPPAAFVQTLENHDQVANTGDGQRLHHRAAPGAWRAMTALVLLGPGTPMLFQGQEFDSSAPFTFFADHEGTLAEQVRNGRLEFMQQFPSIADPEAHATLSDPSDREGFERCRLDLSERERHAGAYALHRDLIALRRRDPAIAAAANGAVDGAVLGERIFLLRYFGGEHGDRLLVVNLGADWQPSIVPEPLLAPPLGRSWSLAWSSEHPSYGGTGTPPPDPSGRWRVPGNCALYFTSAAAGGGPGE